jgi:hypothetical protein
MKKVYTKPEIMFEDFTLSTNIAGNCEHQDVLPTTNQQGCGLIFGPDVIFISGLCTVSEGVIPEGPDDGSYNGICYHVPSSYDNIFAS